MGIDRGRRAFQGWKPWPSTTPYSIEFKRQVAQEYIAGETLHALAKRHDLSRNLIRIWVAKYEAGTRTETAALVLDRKKLAAFLQHALNQARAELGVVVSRGNAGGVQAVQWSLPG